jgi:sugar lactone lactonase YvrE
VPRQTIQLAKVIDAFNTAAVSHDSRAALVVFPDGKLEHFSCPDFQVKGTYRLPKEAYETALDRRGVLYAVCTEFKKGALFPRERRGTGDLYLFPVSDLLAGREAPGKQLQPSKVIPIGGLVPSLALSPAHDWLYCLDATNRKIVRVNTGQARADGELPVEAGTDAMCLTPDGKTLYTVTHGGKLQKFDVARWRLERTFEVGGACRDIQATDDGLVFINSAEGQWVNLRLLNTKTGEVVNWAGIYSSNCIRLAPDQKRLYVSCWNLSPANVTSYYISRDAPAKGRESGGCSLDANFGARGGVAVSPDGRFLFCDAGRIVRLGQ